MKNVSEHHVHHGRIDVVDGFRGWAAILIVVSHFVLLYNIDKVPFAFTVGPFRFLPFVYLLNSAHALTLFFILSGFVLTLPYYEGKRSMKSFSDFVIFFCKRVRRLLPLYYCGFLILAIMGAPEVGIKQTLIQVLEMGTMTYHFIHPLVGSPYNLILWSLELEWWCGLLLPLFFLMAEHFGMKPVLGVSLAICLFFRLVFTHGHTEFDLQNYMSVNNILTRFDAFVLGMAAALAYARYRNKIHPWTTLLTGLAVLQAGFILMTLTVSHQLPMEMYSINYVFITVGWTALVLGSIVSKNATVRLIVANRPIRLAGKMCYSIYVWHYPGIVAIDPLRSAYRFVAYVTWLSGTSWLSYRYIEFRHVKDWRLLLPSHHKHEAVS